MSVIIDLIILFGTVISYYLITRGERAGFFMGLCVQPFWIYTAGKSHSYGILAVSIFFLYCQIEGIIRTRKQNKILDKQVIRCE